MSEDTRNSQISNSSGRPQMEISPLSDARGEKQTNEILPPKELPLSEAIEKIHGTVLGLFKNPKCFFSFSKGVVKSLSSQNNFRLQFFEFIPALKPKYPPGITVQEALRQIWKTYVITGISASQIEDAIRNDNPPIKKSRNIFGKLDRAVKRKIRRSSLKPNLEDLDFISGLQMCGGNYVSDTDTSIKKWVRTRSCFLISCPDEVIINFAKTYHLIFPPSNLY